MVNALRLDVLLCVSYKIMSVHVPSSPVHSSITYTEKVTHFTDVLSRTVTDVNYGCIIVTKTYVYFTNRTDKYNHSLVVR